MDIAVQNLDMLRVVIMALSKAGGSAPRRLPKPAQARPFHVETAMQSDSCGHRSGRSCPGAFPATIPTKQFPRRNPRLVETTPPFACLSPRG